VYYTLNVGQVGSLRAEHRRRIKAGFAGTWLTSAALRRAAGVPGAAAIRTPANTQFDPYKACVGLMQAAARSGAAVFERSRVQRIVREGDGVRVIGRSGTVRAARVVVATGYALPGFQPLVGRFRLKHTYVLGTKRLTAWQRRAISLGRVMLWDTERPYHYARWTPDGRLLLGGEDRPAVSGPRRRALFGKATRELREYFESLFPALAAVEIQAAWEGLFAMTPDGLPYIGAHARYPRHLFALGYGGNGMTFGFLAARILLERWRGIESPDHELFAFGRTRRRAGDRR
jgi:glycine/D-amino acid oxidase-like deaminating enzyme